jgi:hypothetical protein
MKLGPEIGNRAWGALAVLCGLVLTVLALGFTGYSSLQAERLQLDAQQSELAVLTRPRAAKPRVTEKPITINPFLSEANFALSANALQKRVVNLIESTGGKLVSVGVDPPVTGDPDLARRVSVQVAAEMTNDALQKVLYQLESVPPFVFVDTLSASVSQREEPGNKAAVQQVASTAPRLTVTMSVVGYRRKARR